MKPGPFERHIRDAIELNRQRMPLYGAASAGVSLALSRSLIRREQLILPLARWFDRRAEPYQTRGVPVLEDIFVSMEEAPDFEAFSPIAAPQLPPPAPRTIVRRLRRALSTAGFAGAASATEAELEHLRLDPGYWCMLRHMLESSRRVCQCAGRHERAAIDAGMESPLRIHRLLLRLHLAALPGAVKLDGRAAPLQRSGIPILCRDLPPIPPLP